jgi:hypothetical protein
MHTAYPCTYGEFLRHRVGLSSYSQDDHPCQRASSPEVDSEVGISLDTAKYLYRYSRGSYEMYLSDEPNGSMFVSRREELRPPIEEPLGGHGYGSEAEGTKKGRPSQ